MPNTPLRNFLLLPLLTLALSTAANATGRTQTIHFTPGTTSGQYSGTIRGYDYDRYFFQAKAGQHLTVNLNNREVDAIITTDNLPARLDVTHTTLTLLKTGEYELRILQPRAFARRGEVQPYKLTLTIR